MKYILMSMLAGHAVATGARAKTHSTMHSTEQAQSMATQASFMPPREDGRCGAQFGHAACLNGCCSQWGWCGAGPQWCSCANGCKEEDGGRCQHANIGEHVCQVPPPISSNMRNHWSDLGKLDEKAMVQELQRFQISLPHLTFESISWLSDSILKYFPKTIN